VINPPSVQKYGFWTNPELPPDPMDWLAGASHQPGSWWPHWREWNVQHSGELVPARHPGDGKLSVLEDAPGSYVRMRAP
jgi:polyhydroxyalkanoate synthase